MAKKRMFSLNVVDTDLFLEMPITSRLLYYELGMRADDDGFVDNWRKLLRATGLAEDDMKVLIAKRFVIPFESGVIVIRHWRLNNYLQRDRVTETIYKDELSQLKLQDNVYEFKNEVGEVIQPSVYKVDTKCIQDVYTDKIRLDKNRLDKINNIESIFDKNKQCDCITKSTKQRCERKASYCIDGKNYCNQHSREFFGEYFKQQGFEKPSLEEIQKYIDEKKLKVSAKQFYDYFETGNWVDSKGQKVKNWKQKLLTWNKYAKDDPVSQKFFDPNDQYSNIEGFFANI